jgi:hypothetical protein
MIKSHSQVSQDLQHWKAISIDDSGSLLRRRIARRKANIKWFCSILGVGVLLFRDDIVHALPADVAIWGASLILVSLSIVLFRTARLSGENPYLVPFSALSLFFALAYGLGILNVYYYDVYPWEAIPGNASTFLRALPAFPEVGLLILAGGLGVIVGTLLPPWFSAALLPAITAKEKGTPFRTSLYCLLPLFVVSTRLSIWYEAPVLVRHIFTLVGDFGFFIVLVAGAEIAASPLSGIRRWGLYILALFVLTVIVGTPTGMRGHTLRPFILLAIGVVVAYERVPRWLLGILPILVLIIMPFLNYIKVNAFQTENLESLLTSAGTTVASMEFRERLEDGLQVFGNRVFATPFHLAMYMQAWPDIYPFENGQTFLQELSDGLPRIIDPGKGDTSGVLNWYAVRAGIALEPDLVTDDWTSAVFDGMSEYYVNFGPWGIFLLSILHGYYFLILYDWLVVRSKSFYFTALFAYLIWFLWPDSGVVRRALSDIRILVVWIAIFFILNVINDRLGERRSAEVKPKQRSL